MKEKDHKKETAAKQEDNRKEEPDTVQKNSRKEESDAVQENSRKEKSDAAQKNSPKEETPAQKKTKTEDLYKEDALALVGLSPKEKLAYYRKDYQQRTASMEKKEKFLYTLQYYKWYFLGALVLLVCLCWVGKTVYTATLPVKLRVAILNDTENTKAKDYISKSFREYYHLGKRNRFIVYTDLEVSPIENVNEVGLTMNDYQTIGYYNTTNMIDVIIGNRNALRVYSSSDDTTAIDLSMDEELYSQIEEHVVTMTDSKKVKNEGKPYAAAIDISDTEFARGCGLSYEQVYLMIPSSKFQDNERTLNLIKMIFGL